MQQKKWICTWLAAVLCLSGCNAEAESAAGGNIPQSASESETTASSVTETERPAETTAETVTFPAPEPYRFNPHVFSPKLSAVIPQENWDAFYHLCDALRAGETAFACASQSAYEWATDSVVLGHLFPPACMKISGESNDGSVPFENGTGRIYYQIPVAEYTARQAKFEKTVEDVLNTWLEPDDDDFEKCLKLYDYMESTYFYEEQPQDVKEGAHYYTIMTHKGICSALSGVYAYFLMQAGIDATEVGCFEPDMCHSWTYTVLDGKGYHTDPTWALKSDYDTDELFLDYFLMTDARRISGGCTVDDLTVDLLPGFWVSQSSLTFPAEDDRYAVLNHGTFVKLDEQNKLLHYLDTDGNPCTFSYGSQ